MSFSGLTLHHSDWQSYRWHSVRPFAGVLLCFIHYIDLLFHQNSETKNRITMIIFVPDFSGDSRVLQGFLTPMKFIMCLMVADVKAMYRACLKRA
jgi:hypothetical protein